jgi:hypothetical protein
VRRRAGAVFIATALVALAAAALSRSDAPRPIPAAPQALRGKALAIVWGSDLGTLRTLDVRTLRPVSKRRLVLGRNLDGWSRSPDGSMLALLRHRGFEGDAGSVRLVDLRTWKLPGSVDLGDGSPRTVAWLAPDRIVALQDASRGFVVSVIDPGARRVLSRRTIDARLLDVARASAALVLVTAPPAGIGTAKLQVVDAQGGIRSTTLEQTRSTRPGTSRTSSGPTSRWRRSTSRRLP